MTYKLITTSVWGGIPPRFFRFLDMITEKGMPKLYVSLVVLMEDMLYLLQKEVLELELLT
jgi:hypothetical protein